MSTPRPKSSLIIHRKKESSKPSLIIQRKKGSSNASAAPNPPVPEDTPRVVSTFHPPVSEDAPQVVSTFHPPVPEDAPQVVSTFHPPVDGFGCYDDEDEDGMEYYAEEGREPTPFEKCMFTIGGVIMIIGLGGILIGLIYYFFGVEGGLELFGKLGLILIGIGVALISGTVESSAELRMAGFLNVRRRR